MEALTQTARVSKSENGINAMRVTVAVNPLPNAPTPQPRKPIEPAEPFQQTPPNAPPTNTARRKLIIVAIIVGAAIVGGIVLAKQRD